MRGSETFAAVRTGMLYCQVALRVVLNVLFCFRCLGAVETAPVISAVLDDGIHLFIDKT